MHYLTYTVANQRQADLRRTASHARRARRYAAQRAVA